MAEVSFQSCCISRHRRVIRFGIASLIRGAALIFFLEIQNTWRRRGRQRAKVLSFGRETKTKAPAISLLRAPSRSRVYCRTENLEAAISRSAPFITWAFWQAPAEKHFVSASGVARGGNVTWIRERASERASVVVARTSEDTRSSRSCLPIKTGAGNWRLIDWLRGGRIKQRVASLCAPIYAGVFAQSTSKSAPRRLRVDGVLTRKDLDEARIANEALYRCIYIASAFMACSWSRDRTICGKGVSSSCIYANSCCLPLLLTISREYNWIDRWRTRVISVGIPSGNYFSGSPNMSLLYYVRLEMRFFFLG